MAGSSNEKNVETVQVPRGDGAGALPGLLRRAEGERGLVIFAHGSGSSRLSPRNTAVSRAFAQAGLSTLLFDLLDSAEAADRRNVFDIALLGTRVAAAIEWAGADPALASLPLGLFGASTGAAAALVAAAQKPESVGAVVSRGGRPDLAGAALADVSSPTLFIVGGADHEVLALNRIAQAQMRCETALEIVPGATHLFEEPGALDAVVALAVRWFHGHLRHAS